MPRPSWPCPLRGRDACGTFDEISGERQITRFLGAGACPALVPFRGTLQGQGKAGQAPTKPVWQVMKTERSLLRNAGGRGSNFPFAFCALPFDFPLRFCSVTLTSLATASGSSIQGVVARERLPNPTPAPRRNPPRPGGETIALAGRRGPHGYRVTTPSWNSP